MNQSGTIGIGEMKFPLAVDSADMHRGQEPS